MEIIHDFSGYNDVLTRSYQRKSQLEHSVITAILIGSWLPLVVKIARMVLSFFGG